MNGESLNIKQEQIEKLKSLFPEVISEGKIDWEKLQVTLGKDNAEFKNERYVLNWAGKSEAFKILQQSTTATLKPVPDESINFDSTENVFIEGENLEVLKVLQKAYYEKIKCIIIDPPYNTGNDSFIYPDSFKESRDDYQKRIGDKDEEGYLMKEGFFRKNSKDSGHYHSNWLSMMYPRLFLAKNLLRDDGVIFVHIDDNEVHNLRLIMNEIFGEENFVAQLVWKKKYTGGKHSRFYVDLHEYILVFSKSINLLHDFLIERPDEEKEKFIELDKFFNERGRFYVRPLKSNLEERKTLVYPIKLPDGTFIKTQWLVSEDRFKKELAEDRICFRKKRNGKYQVYKKYYELDNDGKVKPESIILKYPNNDAKIELKNLFSIKEGRDNIFYTVKPKELIKYLINQIIDTNNIILDFFAGSATTAHALIEQNKEDGGNRKFILVQLPEPCDEESEAYKAGYKTIADISKERIRRVIQKIQKEKEDKPDLFEKSELDLGFKVFKLSSSNFKIWRGSEINENNLEEQLDAFTNPVKEESKSQNMLYELILKSGYTLTDKVQFSSLAGGKKGSGFYSIKDGELIIALDEVTQKLIDKIISAKPKKVITLDKLFTGNDQLKTNTVLQMKDAEIDFKTI